MKGLFLIIAASVVIFLILIIGIWFMLATPTPASAPPSTPPPVFKPVVDCEMSEWSACNRACGGGTQTRTIIKQPENEGTPCGAVSRACNTQYCPPCTWAGFTVNAPWYANPAKTSQCLAPAGMKCCNAYNGMCMAEFETYEKSDMESWAQHCAP